MRWKPVLNAFAITFVGRCPAGGTCCSPPERPLTGIPAQSLRLGWSGAEEVSCVGLGRCGNRLAYG